eukprot:TRINITY_DN26474_c0_g1_i1.p1 TRINITY_DN26474_c0_g1~~TRINITY_DN26474_c0_g1_i1.p1  ORF type:complete len:731 (+),score=117.08 TRINITY_DN26474_c0_g1_i1:145-2337(+)
MEDAMSLEDVRKLLQRALGLRDKYTPTTAKACVSSLPQDLRFEFCDGLVQVLRSDGSAAMDSGPTLNEFYEDMAALHSIRSDGATSTFCFHRMKLLEMKFELHAMDHYDTEFNEQKRNPHRDFYNVRKVDTHIHHSAAMNGKHLLRFIKAKLKKYPDDIVEKTADKEVTLKEVFQRNGIEWEELSLDKLNVMADRTTMYRFDLFNLKYSPLNSPQLRNIFLKTDNAIGGRYLAEITKELIEDLEESKYQHTEWRISIYGRKLDEWDKLAKWVMGHELQSSKNKWMIQIPRLYNVYKAAGQVVCFQDMLTNIFRPLFEVTLDPSSHPVLHEFLKDVSGFDTVDDESKSVPPTDRNFSSKSKTPEKWDIADNPSYKYYSFYIQTNLRTLNRLRAAKGLSQMNYRPHAGEAGEIHHLDTAFLLADGISHGINLRKCFPLQYLFYLAQIGLAMSPCSNNQLFLSYTKNPFHQFFMRGLNVSLSTDDPLMFHHTKEPLMEEYSIAKQVWRLTSTDLCEIARNSVLQSGFSLAVKREWLGTEDLYVNNITRTNVPDVRVRFRYKCHEDEVKMLYSAGQAAWRVNSIEATGSALQRLPQAALPFLPPEELVNDAPVFNDPQRINGSMVQSGNAARSVVQSSEMPSPPVPVTAEGGLRARGRSAQNDPEEPAMFPVPINSPRSASVSLSPRGVNMLSPMEEPSSDLDSPREPACKKRCAGSVQTESQNIAGLSPSGAE